MIRLNSKQRGERESFSQRLIQIYDVITREEIRGGTEGGGKREFDCALAYHAFGTPHYENPLKMICDE